MRDFLEILKTRRKKNVKKGIQFCLMVCGASGTGSSSPRLVFAGHIADNNVY